MNTTPNIVLVHGAWADGSSWGSVIERLQKLGHKVTAVQIPLTSLDDDVATTRRVLSAQAAPTIVVGHSYGGAVITKLGLDAPNAVGLVYIAAFAPDAGESMKDLTSGGQPPPGLTAVRPDQTGFLWLDPDGFVKYFAPDVDPVQARVMASVQKPISANALMSTDVFTDPTWKLVPSWYLVTDDDQMIPPDAMRFMAQRSGATISSVAASHVPMVSQPDVVVNLIIKAAQSVHVTAK